MAVKIRLKRMGKKKQPTYRVVVADSRSPRDGRIIERLGRYDPRQEPSLVEIDNERAQYWLSTGAQPTDRVRKLLEISGAVARAKVSRSGVYRLDDDPPPVAEKPVGQATEESQEETQTQESQETQEIREEPAAEQSETQPEAGGEVPAESADSPEPSPVDEAKEAEEVEETEVAEEALDDQEPAPGPVGEDPPASEATEASAEPSEQTQDAQDAQDKQEKEEQAT